MSATEALTWPVGRYQSSVLGGAGAYLNFVSQPFQLTSDDRSESTEEGGGFAGGVGGLIHNITLPYTHVTTTETATWDSGKNKIFWGNSDANSGWGDWFRDVGGDMKEGVGMGGVYNTVNMEVSNAGFKGPVLRQRHYSWNLINRSGGAGEGRIIATICRNFQAALYPQMNPQRTGDNIVSPPPMWTTTVYPEKVYKDGKKQGVGSNPTRLEGDFDPEGTGMAHPVSTPGAWRWGMDPFTSVLLNVVISPTEATEGTMTMTSTGWPLVTTLKCSFLEVDQVVANQSYDGIIPYSWASNDDGNFFTGKGGEYSGI
jgi:hypothetical protein